MYGPRGGANYASAWQGVAVQPFGCCYWLSQRAELLFAFTDIFNDFAIQREIRGQGFTALYDNFLESQVATVGIKMRF
jgi:hypothetical protein